MRKNILGRITTPVIAFLLLFGIVRAATSRFDEQVRAFRNKCAADRKAQGLERDRAKLYGKYPTPELSLKPVNVAPGGTAEVIATGKFQPGSAFLFDNDAIQVTKETVQGNTYRAMVQVQKTTGPALANLHVYTPVSGAFTSVRAVQVVGKYEWQLTANNGWRIKMTPAQEADTYRAEFFKGAETQPFRVRQVTLSRRLHNGLPAYSAELRLTPEDEKKMASAMQANAAADAALMQQNQEKITEVTEKYQAQIQGLAQQLGDPKLSAAARQKIATQMEELSKKMQAEMSAGGRAETLMERIANQEKAEFGCRSMSLNSAGQDVQGELHCEGKPSIPVRGTLKYLGQ